MRFAIILKLRDVELFGNMDSALNRMYTLYGLSVHYQAEGSKPGITAYVAYANRQYEDTCSMR
jgi:hypothetical protein